MTRVQKEQNKNYILNNLDKYTIDGKANFINLEKNYDDSDYIIWKRDVEDYEEVKEKLVQVIIKDKNKWGLTNNEEVMEDIAEVILLEKGQWEIVYETKWFGMVNVKPISFKHLPSGKEISVSDFSFKQFYFLNGELGYRKDMWKDYEKRRILGLRGWRKERRERRKQQRVKASNATQPEPPQAQNQTPEPTNSESKQENQKSTPPAKDEPIDSETPSPQQAEKEARENAQKEEERLKKEQEDKRKQEAEEKKQKRKKKPRKRRKQRKNKPNNKN